MNLRAILIAFVLFKGLSFFGQIKMCSWNIQNFGKSKSDSTIQFIASTVSGFDVVAIVEVVAGPGGPQAVARLADELNRKGAKWDYSVSDPTVGNPAKAERYAFLWKTSRLRKVSDGWLEKKYRLEIEREPYYQTFSENNREFTLAVFHAVTKSKQPEREIKYFKYIPKEYPSLNILFCGDFNCSESHTVFTPLKNAAYLPVLSCQKTSLKNECVGENCLASEYDNIFYDSKKVRLVNGGVLEFYKSFQTLREARKISDHLPVFMEFNTDAGKNSAGDELPVIK